MSIYDDMRAVLALDLKPNELKVWMTYRLEMDEAERQVRGKSQTVLRKICGMSKTQFSAASGTLQKLGLITVQRSPNAAQIVSVGVPNSEGSEKRNTRNPELGTPEIRNSEPPKSGASSLYTAPVSAPKSAPSARAPDGFAFDEATVDQPSPAPNPKRARAPKQNVAPEYTADYLAVWNAFPRNPNSSKVDGFRMWQRLDDATKALIPLAVERYSRKVSDPKYAKHLSSWLHGRVFDQYLDATATQSPASASKAADAPSRSEWTTSQWHRMLREYAGSEWNTRELGPVPGFRGCQVPPEIISDLDLLEKYTEWGTARNLHHPTHPAHWHERAAA